MCRSFFQSGTAFFQRLRMPPVLHKFLIAGFAAASLLFGIAQSADKVPVTVSFSILGDLVRVVGGERISVNTLVRPDEDAHAFEPKPGDARALVQSRLLVVNGLGFEPWALKLSRSAGYRGDTVVAATGIKPRLMAGEKGHDGTDPHAWQNPVNVMVYARNIAGGLAKVDPAGAALYQTNADRYILELQALDTEAKAQFSAIDSKKRKVITSHDAFGYFGAQYQIKFLAPQGVSTDAEPSAKQIALLIRQIQREKIRAVFVENMSSPRLLAQLSKDAGVKPGPPLYVDALSAAGGPADTYLMLMRHNVTQLAAGMKLN